MRRPAVSSSSSPSPSLSLLLLLLLLLLSVGVGGQREDKETESEEEDVFNVGQIIVSGRERKLTGTDRIAILRTQASHIRHVFRCFVASEQRASPNVFVFLLHMYTGTP